MLDVATEVVVSELASLSTGIRCTPTGEELIDTADEVVDVDDGPPAGDAGTPADRAARWTTAAIAACEEGGIVVPIDLVTVEDSVGAAGRTAASGRVTVGNA